MKNLNLFRSPQVLFMQTTDPSYGDTPESGGRACALIHGIWLDIVSIILRVLVGHHPLEIQ